LHLKRLILTQFRNYDRQELEFSPRLNCFTGNNGMGKTNLLDAIHYLCLTKSHFTATDRHVVQHEAEFFRLEGLFEREQREERIVAKVIPGKEKTLERSGAAYERMADHIGLLPLVMLTPDDTQLAREGSEERRRFLDGTLAQLDAEYLRQLILYQRVLKQRNALLKQEEFSRRPSPALLEVYQQQLVEPARYIHRQRVEFTEAFSPIFQEYYARISGEREQVSCTYRSQLHNEDMGSLLERNLERDIHLQRTGSGPHRDDLIFGMGEHALKQFASQGQLKSFILALKLTQYELLRQKKNTPPLLLLDDIFDKLDAERVRSLLKLILDAAFGQVFITDTDPDRLRRVMEDQQASYRFFHVDSGKATLLP
jgi:DNA replication and repair protein RecF